MQAAQPATAAATAAAEHLLHDVMHGHPLHSLHSAEAHGVRLAAHHAAAVVAAAEHLLHDVLHGHLLQFFFSVSG